MSLRLMKERIKQSGTSLYYEQIKDAQDILKYGFIDDVSYNPNITIYNSDKKIPIKIFDQKYNASYGVISKFLCFSDFPVELGEILYDSHKKEYWLCVESYDVSGIHCEGKLGKCTRFLKWKDIDGIIREIPIITRNATQYNNGETKTEIMTLGSDQIMLYTQLNKFTVKLDHGMKFFIDENKDDPTVYELTKPDTVDYSYMGKGMISLMMTERAYTPTKEELEIGVCNNRKKYINNLDTTIPPQETDNLIIEISGNTNLKNNYFRTYVALIKDKNNNSIEWNDSLYSWNIISDFPVENITDKNKIKLKVKGETLIGSSFLLQLIENSKKDVLSEVKITIVELIG